MAKLEALSWRRRSAALATTARPPEKATFRTTRDELLAAAAGLRIETAGLDTEALRAKVRQVGEALWLEENREAIEEWNAWVRENGIPHSDLTGS
jgi:antitoxin CcdA